MADDKPVRSPAPRWLKAAIAGVFVLIWLVVIILDFVIYPGASVIPFWFQATGLVVLGYLLGVSVDDMTSGVRGK